MFLFPSLIKKSGSEKEKENAVGSIQDIYFFQLQKKIQFSIEFTLLT